MGFIKNSDVTSSKRVRLYCVLFSITGLLILVAVLYTLGILPIENLSPDELCARGTERLKEAWLYEKPELEPQAEKDFLKAKEKCKSCACPYAHLIAIYTYSNKQEKASATETEAFKNVGKSLKNDRAYSMMWAMRLFSYYSLHSRHRFSDELQEKIYQREKKEYAIMLLLGDKYDSYNKEMRDALHKADEEEFGEAEATLFGLTLKYPNLADELYVKTGYVLVTAKEFERAEWMFKEALKRNPNNAEAKAALKDLADKNRN